MSSHKVVGLNYTKAKKTPSLQHEIRKSDDLKYKDALNITPVPTVFWT